MQVAVGFRRGHSWTPVLDVLPTEVICVTDLDGCLRVQHQGCVPSTAGWETCAQQLPCRERPGVKASHLPATHPCPSGGLQPPAPVRQRHPEARKVLEEQSVPHMRDPGPSQHPRLALRPRGASATRCRCQPTQVRGDNGRGRRRRGPRRRGPRAAGTVLPPPRHVRSRVCVCVRGGGERGGGHSGNFHSLQQPQPPPRRREGGRRAQAPGRCRGGKAAPAPQFGPPASGPLPGSGGRSPLPPPSPVPPPSTPGRGGGAAPGRAAVAPRAGGRSRSGGGAWRGQEAARRSLRSCRRPLSRAARPPARCRCSPGAARTGAAASTACRRGRACLLRCPLFGIAAAPPPPPPPPPSFHPLSRRIPAPPATASSKMPRYELALILKAMQRPETAAVLKRTVEALMERGAVVRNLENLGERSLPYKISKHNERHRRGGYFLIDFEGPPSIVSTMMDHLGRDIDVIRRGFIKHPVSKTEECSGIIPVNYQDKLIVKK
ncbi:small ribosomal subunit protein bS6m [Strix aluco]|uniref:small ribosomal subunit protein bS6m n=1 Tax=Strix aluco TaxID=111821 RepID=UPI003DA438FE